MNKKMSEMESGEPPLTKVEGRSSQFNDMTVMGAPPLKLRNALEIIANHLHQEFAKVSWLPHKDRSKESCILCSLTVREFLVRADFQDADARPVCLYLSAHKGGRLVKQLMVPDPDDKRQLPSRWAGHMVVVIPSAAYLIDTTLYQAARPEWKSLPGMAAVPLYPANASLFSMKQISCVSWKEEDGYKVTAGWLDAPTNKSWRKSGIERMKNLRRPVINKMINKLQAIC